MDRDRSIGQFRITALEPPGLKRDRGWHPMIIFTRGVGQQETFERNVLCEIRRPDDRPVRGCAASASTPSPRRGLTFCVKVCREAWSATRRPRPMTDPIFPKSSLPRLVNVLPALDRCVP